MMPTAPAKTAPCVALLIPCYNCGAFLGDVIAGARRQTLPFAEIIVCDDGSQDDSIAVAERAGARVLRNPKNFGAGYTRNRLIEAASSEFLHFHDADDPFLDQAFLSKVAPRAAEYVISFCDTCFDEGNGRRRVVPSLPPAQSQDWVAYFLGTHVHLNAAIFPRQALLEFAGFVEHLRTAQDLMLFVSAAAYGLDFVHVPETLALHRKWEGSTLARISTSELDYAVLGFFQTAYEKVPHRYHGLIDQRVLFHLKRLVSNGHYREALKQAPLLDRRRRPYPLSVGAGERFVANSLGWRGGLAYAALRTALALRKV